MFTQTTVSLAALALAAFTALSPDARAAAQTNKQEPKQESQISQSHAANPDERQALIQRHRALAAAHQKLAECLASATDVSQCRMWGTTGSAGSAGSGRQSQSLSSRRSKERVQDLLSRRAPAQSQGAQQESAQRSSQAAVESGSQSGSQTSTAIEERQAQSQAARESQSGATSASRRASFDTNPSRMGSAAGKIEQTKTSPPWSTSGPRGD